MRRASLKTLVSGWMVPVMVLLVANLMVLAAWTWPRWSARRGSAGTAMQVESARDRLGPQLDQVRESYGRVAEAAGDLRTFRGAMMSTAPGSDLMGLLADAGSRVGINLDDASFEYIPIDELGLVQIAANLPVVGSYESVRRLLDELSALPTFLIVERVGLSAATTGNTAQPPPGTGDGAGDVRVNLEVSVFVDNPDLVALDPTFAPEGAAVAGGAAAGRDPLTEQLRAASAGNNATALVNALAARLGSLPALPVEGEDLTLHLEKLGRSVPATPSTRNLFAFVLPPLPQPQTVELPEKLMEPEPFLPVRLLGFVVNEGRRFVSLTDGDRVFIVTAGETLPNGVEIVELGADYVEVEFNGERTRLSPGG